jgi:OOP family OmpA-OmpF porin
MSRIAWVVTLLVGASTAAHADVEIGGLAGIHFFNDKNALGVNEKNPTPDSQKTSSIFGARVGDYFNRNIGVEVELGVIPTEPNHVIFDVFDAVYRGHVVVQVPQENGFVPFALAGGGVFQVVSSHDENIIKKDVKPVFYGGVGIKYRTPAGWGVRIDVRAMFPTKFANGKASGITEDFEGLISLDRVLGWKRPEKKAPPPVDDDPDHDGIRGAADKCPNEPEDVDGFQDADGCPDPDNDGDGIPDKDDKCPNEAEDKDGFQDADGCPDPDNDGDGIPDKDDKCPNEAETKNGYQDADGCPDEIPEKVKQFTGAIQGITFKTGAADLAPGSSVILDKAVAVLTEFKDVKLEIQGHTDDVQIAKGGKFADNAALSQARADSVKDYFVKKGIDASRITSKGYGDTVPVVDPKGLTGAKLNDARGKNRRVEFKLITQ